MASKGMRTTLPCDYCERLVRIEHILDGPYGGWYCDEECLTLYEKECEEELEGVERELEEG